MPRLLLFVIFCGFFLSLFNILLHSSSTGSTDSAIIVTDSTDVNYSLFVNWQDYYNSPAQYNIDVLHYDVALELDFSSRHIEAKNDITLVVTQPINSIDLNLFENLTITELTVNGKNCTYTHSGSQLSILYAASVSDTIQVGIKYNGSPKNIGDGSFSHITFNGSKVISTLGEPNYNSTWLACNDRPDDKALLDLRITNDTAFTSVSNGVLIGTESNSSKRTYHWKTVYPISTYLIAIYSGEYSSYSEQYINSKGDTLNLEYYVVPAKLEKAKSDWSKHKVMLDFMDNYLGDYPFLKEKYGIAGFNWQGGAMENQTITGVGHSLINGTEHLETTYLHELVHHWWGNSVGPKSWKDIWLNEGFATYFEGLYLYDTKQIPDIMEFMQGIKSTDFYHALYNPDYENIFSQTVYNKGAWVLHMLRYKMGDQNFFRGLSKYYDTFKYANASTQDFQKICEDISGQNLSIFFNQYVYFGIEVPAVNYSFRVVNQEGKLGVQIEFQQLWVKSPFVIEFDLLIEGEGRSVVKPLTIHEMRESVFIETDLIPEKITPDFNGNFFGFFVPKGMVE